jgi:preprotein translocase subunit SecB
MSDAQAPVFQIHTLYLKEASIEQPNSPAIRMEEQSTPTMDIQLGVEAQQPGDGLFEVSVSATVTAKVGDRTLFLVECKQAGLFEIRGFDEAQLGGVVGAMCPQIVFPYLRSNVSDLVTRAGFPPVTLAEINFQGMYEQQQAAQAGSPIITNA